MNALPISTLLASYFPILTLLFWAARQINHTASFVVSPDRDPSRPRARTSTRRQSGRRDAPQRRLGGPSRSLSVSSRLGRSSAWSCRRSKHPLRLCSAASALSSGALRQEQGFRKAARLDSRKASKWTQEKLQKSFQVDPRSPLGSQVGCDDRLDAVRLETCEPVLISECEELEALIARRLNPQVEAAIGVGIGEHFPSHFALGIKRNILLGRSALAQCTVRKTQAFE